MILTQYKTWENKFYACVLCIFVSQYPNVNKQIALCIPKWAFQLSGINKKARNNTTFHYVFIGLLNRLILTKTNSYPRSNLEYLEYWKIHLNFKCFFYWIRKTNVSQIFVLYEKKNFLFEEKTFHVLMNYLYTMKKLNLFSDKW